jgi:hypothetical protein
MAGVWLGGTRLSGFGFLFRHFRVIIPQVTCAEVLGRNCADARGTDLDASTSVLLACRAGASVPAVDQPQAPVRRDLLQEITDDAVRDLRFGPAWAGLHVNRGLCLNHGTWSALNQCVPRYNRHPATRGV